MNRKAWLALIMMLCLSLPALAQKITVTGTVIDPSGEPLIGATVMAKGTTSGVATDIDGNYRIDVASNGTLTFSYVGYDTQSIPVNGRTKIDVELKENSVVLNDVVVIGYGTVKKSDATGAVSVVKPDEIEAGLSTSVQDMLVGATPGVVVTQTGSPSEGGQIRIRGGSSLSASNDPLIVIDGVPMENGSVKGSSNALALVAPENVESMTVLKDASATAIFGSRASNGVIIITTKKGQSGKPQVNFSANMYVNTARKTIDMMSGKQFRQFIIDTYGEESAQYAACGPYNTDWQDHVLRTSISSDYNLSVGGQAGWLPYRVAMSYTDNNGIMRKSGMDRLSASINLTPKFFDNLLQVNANVKGAYITNQYTNEGALGGAIGMNPTLPIKTPYESAFKGWSTYINNGQLAGPLTPGNEINSLAAINPIALIDEHESHSKVWQSVGNLQFDLRLPFWRDMRANLNLGYDYSHGMVKTYEQPFSPQAWKSGHYVDGSSDPIHDGYTTMNWERQRRLSLLLDFYFNYNKEVKAIRSSFDVTAGYSWQKFENKGGNWSKVYAPGQEFNGYQRDPYYRYSSPYQLVSFFGRFQYDLLGRYLVTATVRRDGSSRFAKDNRWGTFPSVALAWRLIDESFMQGMRGWLSDLKLRGSWGITGQQDLGGGFDMLFPYLPVYDVSTNMNQMYPVTDNGVGNGYIVTPQKYNAALKWEETTTWNVGVDFGFINNRIMGSFEWYSRKTRDLLTNTTYVAGSNFAPDGPQNIGDLTNTGLELNLITRPIVTKNFTWSSNVNVAWNKNKITTLAQGADIAQGDVGNNVNIYLQREGQPMFSFYVYEQVYDQNGKPLEGVFVDRNGDGRITEADKYLFHSRDPKWTFNWQNTFNYKNWDLGISMRASLGNWVYNNNQKNNCFASSTATVPLSNLMSDTYIFKQTRTTELIASDYFVQNAAFVRCDNITLGYTWPELLDKRLRLRLYGAVQNPFVITKYKGIDPEIAGGIDNNPYPKPITFTLGVVATF